MENEYTINPSEKWPYGQENRETHTQQPGKITTLTKSCANVYESHMHTHMHSHTYTFTNMHTDTHSHTCTHRCTHMHASMYIHTEYYNYDNIILKE